MPTATDLLAGHDTLRGQALRDRLTEARRAAAAGASPAAIAEIDAVGIAAMQACIRSYAALLPRTMADLPAAAEAGAARAAARPPAPMRRLPTPPRAADAPDARPAAAAPAVPVADAPAAASDAGGATRTAPAVPPAPPPRPPAAPGRLANLKRPAVEPEPEPAAPVEPAPRNPLAPPGPRPQPEYDAAKLAAHKRRYGKHSWPHPCPDGSYNYDAPALSPDDDNIHF